jgi:hypothetical protein
MSERKYYSVRTGKNPGLIHVELDLLKKLFYATYKDFDNKEYFQQAFGKYCVDAGEIPGLVGSDIELYFFKKLRKPDIWPIYDKYKNYGEDDIFDVIELLYDLISKPLDGNYHSWNDCGWHYDTFNKEEGRKEFRYEINDFLKDYQDGWELSESGEILSKGDEGLNNLYKASLPEFDSDNVNDKVKNAILKFRRHKSSIDERKEAVRELADVLEFLRPQVKQELLPKDEGDLFNIANNFGIRHHNLIQKKEYDKAVWLSWIFYIYLSTIHLVTRLINKDKF